MHSIDQQLLQACQNSDIHTVQTLLQQGANPNERDHELKTALIITAEYGHTPIIALLAQYGANPQDTHFWERNALHHAVLHRHKDAARYLIGHLHLDPNTQDEFGYTPFLIAAQNGDIDMLKLLIQHGADPYITDIKGWDALHWTVENNHPHAAQYLITELRFTPNSQDHQGITPLMIAAKNGHIDLLENLIRLGANPYIRDKKGQNALYYAIKYRQKNTMRYLITRLNFNPNDQDHEGITPFMIAVQYGDSSDLNDLIQLGANHAITDKKGRSALHHAAEWGRTENIRFLMIRLDFDPNSHDRNGVTPVIAAVKNWHIPAIQCLVQLGANPYHVDHHGRHALHYAAASGHCEVIRYLITQFQLDINAQDRQGNTPVLIACKRRQIAAAQTLIRLGANLYIPKDCGQNVIAQRYRKQYKALHPSSIIL